MRIYINSIIFVCLVSFAGCTAWKEPKAKAATWNNSSGAEQYERSMWKAIHDKDWKEVEHHIAPIFSAVDSEGRQFDRAGWIEHWKNAPVREATLGELSVQPSGADMVITYELHFQGDPSPRGLRVISVWQELKKGWVLTAQSMTPITH